MSSGAASTVATGTLSVPFVIRIRGLVRGRRVSMMEEPYLIGMKMPDLVMVLAHQVLTTEARFLIGMSNRKMKKI